MFILTPILPRYTHPLTHRALLQTYSIASPGLGRQRNNEHSLHPEEMQPQIVDKCYADLPPRLSQDTAAEHNISP